MLFRKKEEVILAVFRGRRNANGAKDSLTQKYNEKYPLVFYKQVGQNNKQKKRTAEKGCELGCESRIL